MSRTGWWTAMFAATIFLTACQSGGEQAAEQPQSKEQKTVTAEEVKQKAQETLAKAQQYAQQQKETYQQQMQRKLKELDAHLRALKERTERDGANASKDLQKLQQDVEQKLEVARKQLADLQNASVETWKAMKASVNDALQEAQKSYEEFRSRSSKESNA